MFSETVNSYIVKYFLDELAFQCAHFAQESSVVSYRCVKIAPNVGDTTDLAKYTYLVIVQSVRTFYSLYIL